MTAPDRPLSDATIEAAILRRIGGHADPTLVRSIVAAAATTPQDRGAKAFGGARARVGVLLVAAAIAAIGLAIATGSRPTPPMPSEVPLSTAPAVVPSAVVAPTASVATCATDTVEVLTGGSMPPAGSAPATAEAGVLDLGVYLTRVEGSDQVDVWAIRTGDARRIASIVHPDINLMSVDDISADGRSALIGIGEVHGGLPGPWCDDLYLIDTDGGGATRLTRNGTNEHAVEGSISPDGRYVAYRQQDDEGTAPTLGVIDLEAARNVQLPMCAGDAGVLHPRWAPAGDRLAVICGSSLVMTTIDGSQANLVGAGVRLDIPAPDAGAVVDARWLDATRLLVLSASRDADSSGALTSRVLILDGPDALASGTWSDPTLTQPPLRADLVGVTVAPDAHAFAVITEGADPDDRARGERGAVYVADLTTGDVTEAIGPYPVADPGWSSDSRSVIAVQRDRLMLRDLSGPDARAFGTIPADYQRGIWRGA